ncbi:hypothetical protein BH09VER1_BH09VER1_28580 [soil metagenome]
MKTIAAALVLISASLTLGGEVKFPVPRTAALKIEKPFESFGAVAPRISVDNTKTKASGYGESVYTVQVTGNKSGTGVIEFWFVNAAREVPRILCAGQGTITDTQDSFIFSVGGNGRKYEAKDIKGWFIRLVNNGVIEAVAGSSPKYEAMAADPKTPFRYGEW